MLLFPVSGKPESSFKSSLQKLLDQQPLKLGVLVGSAQIDLLINSGIFLAPPDTSTFQLSKYRSAQAIRRELLILKGRQQAESPVCKREIMRTRFGLRRLHCGDSDVLRYLLSTRQDMPEATVHLYSKDDIN